MAKLLFSSDGDEVKILFGERNKEQTMDYDTKKDVVEKLIELTKNEKIPFEEFRKLGSEIIKSNYLPWVMSMEPEIASSFIFIKSVKRSLVRCLIAKSLDELRDYSWEKEDHKPIVEMCECGGEPPHARLYTKEGFIGKSMHDKNELRFCLLTMHILNWIELEEYNNLSLQAEELNLPDRIPDLFDSN